MCIQQLRKDLENKYGEWLEMGLPLDEILMNLLEIEREKNNYLEKRIGHMQNASRNDVAR